MVLTNLLHIGLFLLLLQITTCISENRQRNQSPTPETTTTSVNTILTTLKSQISPSTTTEESTKSTTSQPKTEIITQNKSLTEQRRNRGNTKYSNAYTTTTKPSKITTISTNTKEITKNRLTTIRNDRSLNINTDKYNPELHSENNIYAETQVVDNKKYLHLDNKDRLTTEKSWDHSNFETILLTTPKDDIFDNKFSKMQEDISKSLTTTPKNEAFDDKFNKMHEDISKSLDDKIDGFFNEPKHHQYPHEEHPDSNDTKIDYMRFRNLESVHLEDNKKVHKDYSDEIGMKMEMSSSYNDTKIIDSPGIVVNTIPTNRKDSETKKPDLDQGETKIEKITIEKPNTFISNKIESDSAYLGATEGYVDKPLENRGIYLSKRGSTVQNKEQTIEKSLSTEAGIPPELYPSKATETLEQNMTIPKKISRKESDLDNKIPKFSIDSITKSPRIESENTSTETLEIISETKESLLSVMPLDPSTTTPPEIDTESPNFSEQTTTEDFNTSTMKFDFTEISTDTPQTEDTTTYTEPTTEPPVVMEFSYFDTDNTPFTAETDGDLMEIDNATNYDTKTISPTDINTEITPDLNVELKNITKYEFTTELGIREDTSTMENVNLTTENVNKNEIFKKNESIPKAINEITKPPIPLTTTTTSTSTSTKKIEILWPSVTENILNIDDNHNKSNSENEPPQKQNEINLNGEKPQTAEECDNIEDPTEDYADNNCNNKQNGDDINEGDGDLDNHNIHEQITTQNDKKPSPLTTIKTTTTTEIITKASTIPPVQETTEFVEEKKRIGVNFEDVETTTRSASIISSEEDEEGGNGGKIAAIVISTVGGICLLILIVLLVIMKKRQKRFNYGQRCRPVSLDAYSMDNVSIHNSTRRKGVLMMSKRSYGNPAFEDPASPSHLLNYSELLKFANNLEGIKMEFDKIPQVTTKTNELPEGCDVKNRYANVIPLPETRVFLNTVDGVDGSDYINANFVTGAQGTRNYYIACQAPMQNTIEDFWRMIWEQQSKVILMLTHLYENGVEKCIDYLPPSEVLDCHRLFGDFQITLRKREVKDKYIISSLQLKNMVSNSWREITHFWYMGWPEKGVPDEANSLIAFLIEARSYIKISDTKVKETINHTISNGLGASNSPNPVIVHCSPGTGRTGTVIACDIAVREFELTRKIDIPRIVYRIRRDRASAVQTKEQYSFIYKVINFYATKLTGGIFDSF